MGTAAYPETGWSEVGERELDRYLDEIRWDEEEEEGGGEPEGLANALGWFSVGLGLAQIVAPHGVARLIGVDPGGRNAGVMRAVGLREMASGIGILSQRRPAEWMWGRVAGDVMDLALLGRALDSGAMRKDRTVGATAAVLGVLALDFLCAKQLTGPEDGAREETESVHHAITVGRPIDEVYAFWHDFENLPRFMKHLESVEVLGNGRSRWRARGPAGKSVEWEAVTTEDRPGERIAWRSVEGSDVTNSGVVRFREAPGGRGTEVHVELSYDPPAGAVGATVAKLFREEPGQQVSDDLRRFKQVMEIGEVTVSDATFRRGPHPGSPPKEA